MPFNKDWLQLSNALERAASYHQVPYVDWQELTDPNHISKCIEIAPVTHLYNADGAVTDTLVAQFVFKTPYELCVYVFDPAIEEFQAALGKFKERLGP